MGLLPEGSSTWRSPSSQRADGFKAGLSLRFRANCRQSKDGLTAASPTRGTHVQANPGSSCRGGRTAAVLGEPRVCRLPTDRQPDAQLLRGRCGPDHHGVGNWLRGRVHGHHKLRFHRCRHHGRHLGWYLLLADHHPGFGHCRQPPDHQHLRVIGPLEHGESPIGLSNGGNVDRRDYRFDGHYERHRWDAGTYRCLDHPLPAGWVLAPGRGRRVPSGCSHQASSHRRLTQRSASRRRLRPHNLNRERAVEVCRFVAECIAERS